MGEKLTYSQREMLRQLVTNGEVWRGCTNATLSALEKRGLADWESVPGRAFERWFPTPAGRQALQEKTDG